MFISSGQLQEIGWWNLVCNFCTAIPKSLKINPALDYEFGIMMVNKFLTFQKSNYVNLIAATNENRGYVFFLRILTRDVVYQNFKQQKTFDISSNIWITHLLFCKTKNWMFQKIKQHLILLQI